MTSTTIPLLIQPLLRAGRTPENIALEFGLEKPKYHGEHPNLVQFKYDQLLMNKSDPLVQQCRGLILDQHRDWACVARPFDKFWNLEEPHAARLDWESARVQEKLDGSMAILYHYHNGNKGTHGWQMATLGRPDASGQVNAKDFTFAGLFWETFFSLDMELPQGYHDLTFMFELMSPWNRVVCSYGEKPQLVLLGARSRVSGEEMKPELVAPLFRNWKPVREFQKPADIRSLGLDFNPLEQEGYVVVDKDFRRVKVKHPGYVLAHALRSSFSTKNALDAIRRGEAPEILAHFPEMKAEMDRITVALEDFKADIRAAFVQLRHIDTQKEFALQAVKTRMGGAPLFYLRAGKGTLEDFIIKLPVDRLVEALGLKEKPAPLTDEG